MTKVCIRRRSKDKGLKPSACPPLVEMVSKSSLRRTWFDVKYLFRRNTCSFVAFGSCLLLFVFAIAFWQDSDSDVGHYHDNLAEKAENSLSEVVTELAGGQDPNTIFKEGIKGNFELKEPEQPSDSPGENGLPVQVNDPKGQQESQKTMREFGFNTYVSDMISMTRTIPDIRPSECQWWHYPEELPTVSVVIVFHNEGWTPLLRTVHTVLHRSPPQLIKEIVMVDDYSDKAHLKEKLDKYILQFNGKVKLVRNAEREGLIRARTIGAQHSTADVVIFLDAHCEVNVNWLPPLLAPIKYNRKVMTVPVIDGIDMNTWAYRSVYGSPDKMFRGIFEWGLLYKETEIPEEEKNSRSHSSQPFRSPTHAGGLFAIDRKWFQELGYYDSGLQIWGGEQYELSFKVWQCGGGILFVPCSHVGHVYRSHMPYGFGKLSGKPVISTNMLRVIKTWMDEYDQYYFIREPSAGHRTPGDISSQLALREKLQCKNFKWYMENVAYDVPKSFPLLPPNQVWGEAKNPATGKCLDTMGRAIPGTVGATPCHGYGGNQMIRLNTEGQMCQGEWCITPSGSTLRTGHCTKGTVDGPFKYQPDTQQIRYTRGTTCLTADKNAGSPDLLLKRCDPDNEYQKWVWKEVYTE